MEELDDSTRSDTILTRAWKLAVHQKRGVGGVQRFFATPELGR